jgi:hypothetical protein
MMQKWPEIPLRQKSISRRLALTVAIPENNYPILHCFCIDFPSSNERQTPEGTPGSIYKDAIKTSPIKASKGVSDQFAGGSWGMRLV